MGDCRDGIGGHGLGAARPGRLVPLSALAPSRELHGGTRVVRAHQRQGLRSS